MPTSSRQYLSKGARIGLLVAAVVGLTTGAMAWFQVQRERLIDEEDLGRRAAALAHQLSWTTRRALTLPQSEAVKELSDRLGGYRRVLGFAVYRADGQLVAEGPGVSEFSDQIAPRVQQSLKSGQDVSEAVRTSDALIHILAHAIKEPDQKISGVLVVLHDMSYVEQRATARLVQFGFWVLLVTLLLVVLVVGATWVAYDRPLGSLAEWMRRLRTDNAPEAPPRGLPTALLATESDRLAASFRAARSTGWQDSHAQVREHNAWTRERLLGCGVARSRHRQMRSRRMLPGPTTGAACSCAQSHGLRMPPRRVAQGEAVTAVHYRTGGDVSR